MNIVYKGTMLVENSQLKAFKSNVPFLPIKSFKSSKILLGVNFLFLFLYKMDIPNKLDANKTLSFFFIPISLKIFLKLSSMEVNIALNAEINLTFKY